MNICWMSTFEKWYVDSLSIDYIALGIPVYGIKYYRSVLTQKIFEYCNFWILFALGIENFIVMDIEWWIGYTIDK